MTATQPTPMAATPDLRPDPAPAATAAASEAESRSWLRDHPIQTAIATAFAGLLTLIATAAVGLLFFVLNDHGNKIDKLDTKVDEINLNLTTQINELDLKLSAQIYELNVKLTALIAGLGMTDLVDAAVEGRLPAAEPAEAEPAGAPN